MTARSYKSYQSALLLTLMVFEKNWLVAANDAYPLQLSSLLETFSFRHQNDASFSDGCSLTATCQRNLPLLDSFMTFILSDTNAVPSLEARFALAEELLFIAFEA